MSKSWKNKGKWYDDEYEAIRNAREINKRKKAVKNKRVREENDEIDLIDRAFPDRMIHDDRIRYNRQKY